MMPLGLLALVGAAGASPLEIPYETLTLENGLRVILHRDPRLPLVAVSVWYDVGGLHERPGRSGFAHLFEHMMFQRTAHVEEDRYFAYLEGVGATNVNGTTDFDRTNYFETVPKNAVELALWLESSRMGFLLPALDQKSLDGQIDVVKNERRQSVENAPYGLVDEKIVETLFPAPHPYFGNVIGSMADLSAATLDDVRDFFKTYYSPANATLAIGGDFEPEAMKELVNKYFGSLRGRTKPLPPKIEVPSLAGPKTLELTEAVATLPRLSLAWLCPPAFAEDNAALDMLASVLSGTKSSRLDKRLQFDDELAQSVTAYLEEHKAGSTFRIDVVVRPGRTIDETEKAVLEVLADLDEKRPPTEAELQRGRNITETRLISSLEVLGGFSGRVERLQLYQHFLGDPGKIAWDLGRYQAVKLDDLRRVKRQHLGKNVLTVKAVPAPKGAKP